MEDSRFGRMLSVLWSPTATFESIARRPTWVVPLLVLALVTAVFTFVVHQHTDYYELTQYSMERGGNDMSDEQLEGIVEMQEKVAGFGWIAVLVIVPLFVLLFTLLSWVGLKLLGGDLSFLQALGVQTHASMPAVLLALIGMAVIAPQGDLPAEQIANQSYVMSNLAFLAPEGAGAALTAVLASLEFFSIWGLILAVIGYRVAARVSTGVAAVVVGILWLLGVALRVGGAILSAGGMG